MQTAARCCRSPNFSVGVHLFLRAAVDLARQFQGRDFDGSILEQHHTAKRDAPSGTALQLQAAVSAADPGPALPDQLGARGILAGYPSAGL
jgi:4-hydroxy-tetrahydrodipicolinate reductase